MADLPDSARAKPSQKTTNAVWLDVNSNAGLNGKSDLLPNEEAINNSLFNLFNCPIGARGPLFQPEYGTILHRMLHEPLDYNTANKIRAYLFQAVQRWEPRIILDMATSMVIPDLRLPGYMITLNYSISSTGEQGSGTFKLSLGR